MKQYLLLLPLGLTLGVNAQKKADRKVLASLQAHVAYLADDKLEGRRTGTAGEKLAYTYISEQMKAAGLTAKGEEGYLQTFVVREGVTAAPSAFLKINDKALKIGSEALVLPFSANKNAKGEVILHVNEPSNIWLVDAADWDEYDNPHADMFPVYQKKTQEAAKQGATAVIFYNGKEKGTTVEKWMSEKTNAGSIPAIWLDAATSKTFNDDDVDGYQIDLSAGLIPSKRTGTNVAGFIDNNATETIVFGAHYDHLGYGEDHNSLSTTNNEIHNGADDNASGTAALLELAKMLKASKLKKYNYLFLAFSGEELGLYGSKYYTEHSTIDLTNANYMINMDMVGRLSDTKGLEIGGVGTSPSWGAILKSAVPSNLKVSYDSSGVGPSDHTSFYLKNIPVLFFFTGSHSDYHKPSDDADKVNYEGQYTIIRTIYNIVDKTSNEPKLAFTKTKDKQTKSTRFSVSLGIMPDYTYDKGGVKVDGVSPGKVAEKAGISVGDIVVQLGKFEIRDMDSYMEALGSFKAGDKTNVKVKRGNEVKSYDIAF
ncbi:Zn-dependent M28 family amino/carboxypeptidase [Chitinophaga skermanii]|uniref:Zn-dependent M28 family amino/carboxypeptidase n=1 Tax=Chitinophaga skermanii TaxID=331697 RepID=A0A327QE30_9BACT|nr:M20/M25/M40 family metallo-hydrolase [Chitinophaga skermanii]RAJ01533.1 Zn-dependent M28 family amino/carboxypeptidase [Chitinophaga skermanii]